MASEIPATMKAWAIKEAGPPETALEFQAERAAPAPPTGSNIVVRVAYAALNPADIVGMQFLPAWLPFRRNPVPGLDFVGHVVAAGPSVPEDKRVGAQVCGALGVSLVFRGHGSLAEYVSVPASLVVVKPDRLHLREAAGLMGIAGQTAVLVVAEADKLGAGSRVLVNGGSGGVGSILVQVAKARGASVTAICSGANEAMVRKLGADEIIDYKMHDPVETVLTEKYGSEKFDYIFDTVGSQSLYSQCMGYMKPEGKLINIVGGATQGVLPYIRNCLIPVFLGGISRTYRLLGLLPTGGYATEAAKWVNEGLVKSAPIDSEYALEDVPKAFERLGTKRAKGKVVVRIHD